MTLNSKVYHSWADIEASVHDIHEQLIYTNWKPDVIIGIANGGSIPATMLSKLTNIPCKIVTVQLRDGAIQESLYLEDIYAKYGWNILIVDEINDTGATLDWIINNWNLSTEHTRIATLTYNKGSIVTSDYFYWKIDKRIDPVWIVYPWEYFVDKV